MYWDAYIADTTHLSTEEHGAYLLLLAAMWRRNGSVPDEDKDCARIVGLSTAKWRKTKARLLGLISIADGHITQKKLQKTWEKTQEKIAKNRANGAKGGLSKSSNNKDLVQANATNSLKRNPSIPEPEPEPIKRDTNVSLDQKSSSPRSSQQFEEWWKLVPRKVGKGNARAAYARALKKTTPEILEAQIKAYAQTRAGEDPQFTAHPTTWLNAERWMDEAPAPMAPRTSAQQPSVDRETYGQEAARVLGRIGSFADQVGEEPRVIQFAGVRA
jgi:uncharacterized protein YdaU (DUF1376 family)